MSRLRQLSRVLLLTMAGVGLSGSGGPARAGPAEPDIWAWGRRTSGALGVIPPNETVPTPLSAPRDWIAVEGGAEHTVALTATGEVWVWGDNSQGQLGTGNRLPSLRPQRVSGVSDVTLIAAGGSHTVAYSAISDTLWAWGSNGFGQLAQPAAMEEALSPIVVETLSGLVALAAGSSHNLALTETGEVYAWGGNFYGQLGLGDFDARHVPVLVESVPEAIAVGAGSSHSIAVTALEGRAWTWGWNVFGALGNGEQGAPDEGFPDPAPALGVVGVDSVDGGDFHSVARATDGTLWAWGYNTQGQVGNGDKTPANTGILTPVHLDGPTSIIQVRAGGAHTIALEDSGAVWIWGTNQLGSLGNNSRIDERLPIQPLGLPPAELVAAGGKQSFAVARAAPVGALVERGRARPSSVGSADTLESTFDPPDPLVALSAGRAHTVALDAAGQVWTWGQDDHGQLGTVGGPHAEPRPVAVPLAETAGVAQVAAGPRYTLALRSDGTIWAWGDNRSGQLGLAGAEQAALPVQVEALGEIVALSAGARHALGLDTEGRVWAWGDNEHGQLGREPGVGSQLPAPVPSLFGTIFVAAGDAHSIALGNTGGLTSWGASFAGQLGQNRLGKAFRPREVWLDEPVTTVAAGRYFTVAVASGGELWGFGDASECQIGLWLDATSWVPIRIDGAPRSVAVDAGGYHAVALDYEHGLFGWGNDSRGQIGGEAVRAVRRCASRQLASGVTATAAGYGHTVWTSALP